MKYALIGCGRISTNHVKAVINNNLEFVAVCDVVPEHMEEVLAKHDLQNDTSIKRYTDYKKLVEENELDLVGIATESGIHAEIALYCIEHNINVIIEKPMAMSIEDADKIIKLSEEKGVKVSACHQNRFNIAVQEMRKALEAGRFGKLSHGSIHVRWNRNENYYTQAPWRGTWAQDGGALMNQCIHGIDLLRWMLGNEIDEVYGVTKQQFHDYLEAEDIGMAVVKFKNGAVATIEGTTNVYPQNLEETLYLFGETGTVKLGGKSTNNIDVWNFADETEEDQANKGLEEATSNVYGNGHTSLYADVIDAIENDRAPYVDAYAGRNAEDADKIIKLSEEKGVKVSACHQNRFNIAVQEMRKALEAGRFGKLSHGSIHVRWNRNENYYTQAPWRGTWAQDGGALMNQCIHGIDLLRWMLGNEIDEVYGVTKQQFHDYLEAEDIGMAVVKFKNGAVATIEGTTNVYPQNLEETLYLFGETGTVKLGGKSTNNIDVWNFADETEEDQANKGLEEATSNVYGNGHTSLYADVIDAIENDRAPYVDAYAGRNALELVLAIYKSQKEGKAVKLPLDKFASVDMTGEF